MSREVIVTIQSRQRPAEGSWEEDEAEGAVRDGGRAQETAAARDGGSWDEIKTAGQLYERNGSRYLLFTEPADETASPVRTRIRIEEGGITVVRKGEVSLSMTLEGGKSHPCPYQTPYGRLMLMTRTKEIAVSESEHGIKILADYLLYADGTVLSENSLLISAADCGAG